MPLQQVVENGHRAQYRIPSCRKQEEETFKVIKTDSEPRLHQVQPPVVTAAQAEIQE